MPRLGTLALILGGSVAALGAWSAASSPRRAAGEPRAAAVGASDVFAEYLSTPFPPADGFDLPLGDGDGDGGGNTDFGQPVHAIGNGRVVKAGNFTDPF